MVKGKQKGNKFENKIADILTEKLEKQFIRSPGSGSKATKTGNQKIAGDLICIDGYFPYVIETKHYKKVDFSDLLKNNGNLVKWLKQLDKEKGDKKGLLIFKGNYTPIYCAIETEVDLGLVNSFRYGKYVFCLFNDVISFLKEEIGG